LIGHIASLQSFSSLAACNPAVSTLDGEPPAVSRGAKTIQCKKCGNTAVTPDEPHVENLSASIRNGQVSGAVRMATTCRVCGISETVFDIGLDVQISAGFSS
jgi:hypothetical protein